jgi:hypothetical protein
METKEISRELQDGIAAYHSTWDRFNGLTVCASVGSDPATRKTGVFSSGNCQPTIVTPDGRRYLVQNLGSIRVTDDR